MAKKKAAKKAPVKQKKTKVGSRKARSKSHDAAVKAYQKKYEAWEAIARKVLAGGKGVAKDAARKVAAAKKLMALAGGYEEAFVILDAVMIVAATKEDGQRHQLTQCPTCG